MTYPARGLHSFASALFLAAGLLLLTTGGSQVVRYATFQERPALLRNVSLLTPPKIAPIGRLTIPRLGVSVAVVEGDDEESLSFAPGHVAGTEPLGSFGNAVIAGHRDSTFRALRLIKLGDQVEFSSARHFTYAVSRIRTVAPDDVAVLQNDGTPKLTLLTCYPFYYVGSAPRRFVVEARLIL